MSKRLQVVVGDEELEGYASTAEALGLTVSEWVRQSLRAAEREVSTGDVDAKLAAIRKAAGYRFQEREVDIDTMLAETEASRLAEIDAGMSGADSA
ncbi:MAG: vapB13 [Solirubrobacterales bacterium]|nr:vapB13 [Solirubrobacterales bacterium]